MQAKVLSVCKATFPAFVAAPLLFCAAVSAQSAHSASLNWIASTSPNVIGYNVYRGTISGGPYDRLNSLLVGATSYVDRTIVAGPTYYYVVTAVDSAQNESAYSNEARAVVPSIAGLSPNSINAGSPGLVLFVTGAGFEAGATVLWNGVLLTTSFIAVTELAAVVPANLIASQGSVNVSVQNPSGAASNGLIFTINPPAPSLVRLSPNSAPTGGPAFTLTVNGSGFLPSSAILWNGSPLTTGYVNGSQLMALVPAGLIASQGSASVTVQNPSGATSNALTFTIGAPQLAISTPSSLVNGVLGAPYSQELTAIGGAPPYKGWALVAGSLPPGLAVTAGVQSGTGLLSGIPTLVGTFTFTLQVTDNTNATATRQFSLNITAPVTLFANGIVNAASYAGGSVAPGELVTIFGSFPGPATLVTLQLDSRGYVATSLGGAQVLFDGVPGAMIYAEAGQVSVAVPYAVSGKSSTLVQVSYQGQLSNSVVMPVSAVFPGVFTIDYSGHGPGAIVNQDGTVNSANNTASVGSYVSVYATGEGQTNPPGVDGKPGNSPAPQPVAQPVTATVGGIDAPVQYAGGAPSMVAGVLQVNVQVPARVTPGAAVPIVLNIGGTATQPNVTLAVAPGSDAQAVAAGSVSPGTRIK